MQKKLLVAQWFEQLQLKLCSTPDVWADKRYYHLSAIYPGTVIHLSIHLARTNNASAVAN